MRIKANKLTPIKCAGETINVFKNQEIELNLDDFEVVDGCDCVKYCHSSTRLRKTWYTCKHGTREMKLANPKPDTPKPIEMQEDVRGLTLPTIRWMEQVTDTVNKLTSTTDSQCKCDTRTAI